LAVDYRLSNAKDFKISGQTSKISWILGSDSEGFFKSLNSIENYFQKH
jgi:hypothetical protein